MLTTILVCLLGAAISGGSGYVISRNFWRTEYAAKNTSGDFGTPRGGFFAVMSGTMIGLFFFSLIGQHIFPQSAVGPAMITSMIVGAVAGFIGLTAGKKQANQVDASKQDKTDSTGNKKD
jgi:hypothetical protein